MPPHCNGIAAAIKGNLRVLYITCIICLEQFSRTPAGTIKTVGINIISSTVILVPHCNGIAAAINGNLRHKCITCIICLDQFSRAPAGAIKTIGIKIFSSTVTLLPHCNGIAAAIKGNLRRKCTICIICLEQFSRTPAGTIKTVGINIISSTVILVPHCNGIAAAINGNLRHKCITCIICLDQFSRAPAGAIKTVSPNIINSTVRLIPHCNGIAAAIKGNLRQVCATCIICLDQLSRAPITVFRCKRPIVISPHQGPGKITDAFI